MFAPHFIRRTLAIAAMTAVVSAAPAVAQVGVTADGAGEPTSARPGLLSKIHIDAVALTVLAEQGYGPESVPPTGTEWSAP